MKILKVSFPRFEKARVSSDLEQHLGDLASTGLDPELWADLKKFWRDIVEAAEARQKEGSWRAVEAAWVVQVTATIFSLMRQQLLREFALTGRVTGWLREVGQRPQGGFVQTLRPATGGLSLRFGPPATQFIVSIPKPGRFKTRPLLAFYVGVTLHDLYRRQLEAEGRFPNDTEGAELVLCKEHTGALANLSAEWRKGGWRLQPERGHVSLAGQTRRERRAAEAGGSERAATEGDRGEAAREEFIADTVAERRVRKKFVGLCTVYAELLSDQQPA